MKKWTNETVIMVYLSNSNIILIILCNIMMMLTDHSKNHVQYKWISVACSTATLKTETKTVPRWSSGGRCGPPVTRASKYSSVGTVCDEETQIIMATAGAADSGSITTTGMRLIVPNPLPQEEHKYSTVDIFFRDLNTIRWLAEPPVSHLAR